MLRSFPSQATPPDGTAPKFGLWRVLMSTADMDEDENEYHGVIVVMHYDKPISKEDYQKVPQTYMHLTIY